MTPDRETLGIIGSWMEDGRTRLPDDVLDAVLAQLPTTPQRRPWWSVRRIPNVNGLAKYAIAAAAVVVVAIVGLNIRGTSAPGPGAGVTPSPVLSPSPSPAKSDSPAPTAPTSGSIDAGRYRWTAPGGTVTFEIPDGWTGTPEGILRDNDTPTHTYLIHFLPGSRYEVTHVYADACKSEGRLEPLDPAPGTLPAALEEQASTEAGTSWFNGPGGVADPPVGQMVEISEEPGLDRSTCRYGSEGPLQIWADPAETSFFALAPGHRGVVYYFEEGGTPFVFAADLGPEVTDAGEEAVSDVVRTFQFSPTER